MSQCARARFTRARRYPALKSEVCGIGKWDWESLELAGNYIGGRTENESLGGQA